MKMTRKEFLKTLATGAAALLVGTATGCKNTAKPVKPENPYAYDISRFKLVPPELIAFKELPPLDVPLDHPQSVAVATDHTLLVAGGKKLLLYPPGQKKTRSIPFPRPVSAVAALSPDEIYTAFKDRVIVLNQQGRILKEWTSLGEKAYITGIDVNNTHVVIADYGNKQLWLYDKGGALQNLIGVPGSHRHASDFEIPSPYFDVHFAADGTLWATNPGKHELRHYALDGTLLSAWGSAGMSVEGFSGCCNPTHFVIMPNQNFITVEKGLVRIKQYSPDGKFLNVVAAPDRFHEELSGIDMATDKEGKLFIIDQNKKQIRIFVELK